MVGLALGPYLTGKIATVTGDLRLGVYSVFLVTPVTLTALWMTARRCSAAELTKFERAGLCGGSRRLNLALCNSHLCGWVGRPRHHLSTIKSSARLSGNRAEQC